MTDGQDPLMPKGIPDAHFTFPDELSDEGLDIIERVIEQALPASIAIAEDGRDGIILALFIRSFPIAMKQRIAREDAVTIGEQLIRFGKGEE